MKKEEVISAILYLQKYKTETDKVEAKSAVSGCPSKLYDTISAFSNKDGGLIIFGINEENDFSVDGVYDANDLQNKITNLCSQSMEPVVRPEILTFEYNDKTIVAVKINEMEQLKKPCYYKKNGLKNGAYTRIADRDDLLTDYEIYAMESYKDRIIEDKRPVREAKLEDLNQESLNAYVEKVKLNRPNFSKFSFEKCLTLSNVLDQNGEQYFPTIAGLMTFGEYPQSFYPQLFVACTVIPGKNLGDTGINNERFLDNQRVEGTIEEMYYKTMNFITRNMKTRVIIDSFGKRTDISEYPFDALKEAVVNALVHRDYSSQTQNAYISVTMFTDRIEITNPGVLYGTNKIDKLGSSSSMESRNPNIVKILEESHIILENRHTGIPTIIREMKKSGLPEPEFIEERDCFKVILKNGFSEQFMMTGEEENNSSKQLMKTAHENSSSKQLMKTAHENSSSKLSEKSIKTQMHKIKVLQYCNEPKSMNEILKYLKLNSRSHVRRNIIAPLLEDGSLKYVDTNIKSKTQKYVTSKTGEACK